MDLPEVPSVVNDTGVLQIQDDFETVSEIATTDNALLRLDYQNTQLTKISFWCCITSITTLFWVAFSFTRGFLKND